jgi:hypothetical protein
MRGGRFPDNAVPPCDECMKRDGHFCPGIIPTDGGKGHLCTHCDDGEPCGCAKDQATPAPSVIEANPLVDVPEPTRAELIAEQLEEQTNRASLKAAKALKSPGPAPKVSVRRRTHKEQAARENPAEQVLMRLHGELVDLEARAADTRQLIALLERQSRRWETGA